MIKKLSRFLPVLLICLVGLTVYSQTFHHSFQFDDFIFIINNPTIKDVMDIKPMWDMLSQPSRFIGFFSFAVNYHFHQLDTFGYHVTNMVIHLMNAVLVWWLVGMLVESLNRVQTPEVCMRYKTAYKPRGFVHGSIVALCAALIFVCHPAQTQAVTYITQRMASLATLFYLLSLCLYIKGRNKWSVVSDPWSVLYFVGAAIAAVLGMFTKEIVITLPLTIILVEWAFLQKPKKNKKTARGMMKLLYFSPIVIFMAIIPFIFSFNFMGQLFGIKYSASHAGDVITFGNYFITQFRVMMTFLKLCILPIGQNVDYDYALSKSFFEPAVFFSFSLLLAIFLGAVKLAVVGNLFSRSGKPKSGYHLTRAQIATQREKKILYGLSAFGIFWFFLTLSPNFVPRRHIIFEHKMYLPMVGFSLAVSVGLHHLMKNFKKFLTVMSIIFLTLSYLTVQRNKIWETPVKLWRDIISKSPRKPRSHNNMGNAYYQAEMYDLAFQSYNNAVKYNKNYIEGYINRGLVYKVKGQYDLAIKDLSKALRMNSTYLEAYNSRALCYDAKGMPDLAIADYNKALEINPGFVAALGNRGVIYDKQRKYDLALADFNKALEINPHKIQLYNNRGNIYRTQRKYDLALIDYNKGLSIAPKEAGLYNNRGILYEMQGSHELALADYNKALALNPRYVKAYSNRGLVYKKLGQFQLALNDFQMALSISPNFAEAYYNIGNVFRQVEQYDVAITHYTKAIAVHPNYAEAYNNRGIVYGIKGEEDLALVDFNRALKINPYYTGTYSNRGVVYMRRKQYRLALADYNKALSINPNFSKIYYQRSLTHSILGHKKQALADLQKAKSLGYPVEADYH